MTPKQFSVRVNSNERVECEHVYRRAQVPQTRLAMPLPQLEQVPMERVYLTHLTTQQPLYIPRNPNNAVEVKCVEAHTHQVLAFGRRFGLGVDLRLEVRKHLLDHRDALGGLLDARIGVLCAGLGRRCGRLRLPGPQESELRIGPKSIVPVRWFPFAGVQG